MTGLGSASDVAWDDYLWDELLQLMEDRRVVPVVGPDLATFTWQGRDHSLYPFLAERLASYLRVPADQLGDPGSINEVVCRFKAARGETQRIYSSLRQLMPAAAEIQPSGVLLKLADIPAFQLFITTTFDSLLTRAIDQVRFGSRERTAVYSYSPKNAQDLPAAIEQLDGPLVFHLFGKVSSVPEYAVTDEDVLEFMHSLQSETRRPQRLFDAVSERTLLIVGTRFSDWLARFFIRIAKRERLSQAQKVDVLVERGGPADQNLVFFLQSFSQTTRLLRAGPAEFVDELHRRWHKRHPASSQAPAPGLRPSINEMPSGAVFVSYASEDRKAAETIRDRLAAANVDVWLDVAELQGGDIWERRIRNQIRSCSLFVPVISRHCLDPRTRFFRKEWRQAAEVWGQRLQNKRFIVPIVIDETSREAVDDFHHCQWEFHEDGQLSQQLVEVIRNSFREYQLESSRFA